MTVYEQDSALNSRPRDWDFGIYWAQVPLVRSYEWYLSYSDPSIHNRVRQSAFLSILNGKLRMPKSTITRLAQTRSCPYSMDKRKIS